MSICEICVNLIGVFLWMHWKIKVSGGIGALSVNYSIVFDFNN